MAKNKKLKYSNEDLEKIALKYPTRSAFQFNQSSKYNLALRRGILDKICSHMPKYTKQKEKNPNYKWTDEQIILAIKECEKPQVFKKRYPKLYGAAHRRGLLNLFQNKLKKTTIEEVVEFAKTVGYSVISKEIKNAHSTIEFVCKKGHPYSTKWTYFKNNGDRCGRCSRKKISDGQIDLLNWIKQFYPNTESKKIQSETGVKEIDIFISELRIGIEYNGVYWHQEGRVGTRYHLNKTKLAKQHGVTLLHIFDWEWLQRKDQVKNFILSKIQKNNLKTDARKCTIKIIQNSTANEFLERYHILGKANILFSVGCFLNNELIGVMTFGNHHRQNKNELVLNRLCFKSGVSVRGGPSKILSFSIKHILKKYPKYNRILSWSDSRWTEGRVYEKLGFSLEKTMPPDYFYAKNDKVILKKQNAKKKSLLKQGAIGNTEKEMAQSLGFFRVWDCGKKRWVLNLKTRETIDSTG